MNGQYEFTSDWVTKRHDIWTELFASLRGAPQTQMLEIGSYEGRSAIWFLDHVLTAPTARLTCVDIWHNPERERRFDMNIAKTGCSEKVIKVKRQSHRLLGNLTPSSFHAAYIDGSHEARDVLRDGLMTLPLIKSGGIILFDDYKWTDPENVRTHLPGKGIDAFLALCDDLVEVVFKNYQVAVRKIK